MRELAEFTEAENKFVLSREKEELLNRYVELFNARDFDGVRELLADEVRLDLVGHTKRRGADEIRNNYFKNYSLENDWLFALGTVESSPAVLVYNPQEKSTKPYYFILLDITENKVWRIRDYRYASYVIRDAKVFADCSI